jgi:hypothetical protein
MSLGLAAFNGDYRDFRLIVASGGGPKDLRRGISSALAYAECPSLEWFRRGYFCARRGQEICGRVAQEGGEGYLVGRRCELAREFLKEDLVDELYLGIVPVLLGEGIPLFAPGFPQREFTLTESKTYSGGLIALKYDRARGKAAVEAKSTNKSKRKR